MADVPVETAETETRLPHHEANTDKSGKPQATPAFLGAPWFRICDYSEDLAVDEREGWAGEDEAQQHHVAFHACPTDAGSQQIGDSEPDETRQPDSSRPPAVTERPMNEAISQHEGRSRIVCHTRGLSAVPYGALSSAAAASIRRAVRPRAEAVSKRCRAPLTI
jgi:hypothetical protein